MDPMNLAKNDRSKLEKKKKSKLSERPQGRRRCVRPIDTPTYLPPPGRSRWSWQPAHGLLQRGLEPVEVHPDVLLVQVGRLERVPALLVHGVGVGEHLVVPRVLVDQQALLQLHVVVHDAM